MSKLVTEDFYLKKLKFVDIYWIYYGTSWIPLIFILEPCYVMWWVKLF